ncbi:MAG: peptide transporter [Rhizobacter sp.]|nr:peptide transporter [Rhizobacter sp.]
MIRYVGQRVLGMLVVMFLVVTIVFVIVRVAPGDPAAVMLGPEASANDITALRRTLGLDEPRWKQYGLFVGQLARGDLGQSIFLNRPVTTALAQRTEPTLFLTLFTMVIATFIAVPLGVLAAYRRDSWLDRGVTAFAMLGASVPSFWLGLLLIQMVAVKLGWLPVSGYGDPYSGFFERLSHLLLPAAALGIGASAIIVRSTRASMLDVLNDHYVRTARSKGMSEFRVVAKHALKNALIPILTVLGLTAASLISGAVVTETVFSLPGIGNLVVSAVARRDYPVIQGALLVIAALYVLFNFAVDMLYLVVDPRVRLQ